MSVTLDTSDIQGNILKGYRFPHVAHLFGWIDASNVTLWRTFLRTIAQEVTVAHWREKPRVTLNIGFSYRGISKLRPSIALELSKRFEAFAAGMASRAAVIGDDQDFQRRPWEDRHVWLSLHAQTAHELDGYVSKVRGLAARLDLAEQQPRGAARVIDGHWYEHFGFRDDISYPIIEGTPGIKRADLAGRGKLTDAGWVPIAAGEFVLGQTNEDGESTLANLSADAVSLLRNGTFGVFRHLRQDVAEFRRFIQQKSGPHASPEYIAAHMMGRTFDGKPLARSGDGELSNFRYEADKEGARCPLGAHVRRANPRMDGRRRLVRRGMSYGVDLPEGSEDSADRGIWFVAFNASIERQFEFIQQRWLNGLFGTLTDARDPIVGAGPTRAMAIEGDASEPRAPILLLDIPKFVSCRGGQYYLMPGAGGLDFLCSAPPLSSPPPASEEVP
jgi:Dyp-type peroxidase family